MAGDDSCIRIEDSDEHFIIENCTLSRPNDGIYIDGPGDAAIRMVNVSNGVITDNTLFYQLGSGFSAGVFMHLCENISITDNTMYDLDYGIIANIMDTNLTIENNYIYIAFFLLTDYGNCIPKQE